jgi:hypothetical protein
MSTKAGNSLARATMHFSKNILVTPFIKKAALVALNGDGM